MNTFWSGYNLLFQPSVIHFSFSLIHQESYSTYKQWAHWAALLALLGLRTIRDHLDPRQSRCYIPPSDKWLTLLPLALWTAGQLRPLIGRLCTHLSLMPCTGPANITIHLPCHWQTEEEVCVGGAVVARSQTVRWEAWSFLGATSYEIRSLTHKPVSRFESTRFGADATAWGARCWVVF